MGLVDARASGTESTRRGRLGFRIGTTSSSHDGAYILSGCPDQFELALCAVAREAVQELLSENSICRFRCGRWDAICEPGD